MRVVYYSRAPYLDHFLPQVEVLAERVHLEAILEISPETRQTSMLDISRSNLRPGVQDATNFFSTNFPERLSHYWQKCESFNLAIHSSPKSIHPASWNMSRKVIEHIRGFRPDVVHFDDISLRMAPVLGGLSGIPILMSIHDGKSHSGEGNWRSDLARWMSFRRVQHLFVHSRFSYNELVGGYSPPEGSVTVVALGILDIYKEWLAESVAEEACTVLFLGRLSPYKGVDTFVRAAEVVARSLPDARFIIAGKPIQGYSMPPLRGLSNGGVFEIHERYLSNTEVANFMARSTMVVCPYLDASQSGVVLTAYAFNKPVVATDAGGLPEYVWEGETGSLVPPGDVGALAEAIVRVLSKVKRGGFPTPVFDNLRKNELSWSRSADKVVSVYERLKK